LKVQEEEDTFVESNAGFSSK
jgi:hypothetical protein